MSEHPSEQSAGPSTTPTSRLMEASGLAANAARSNLTSFRPDDRVYVKHQQLPSGSLHQTTVTKVVNASVHFKSPIPGILKDPDKPEDGELRPTSASDLDCLPELGSEAGVVVEDVQRDGATWKRLIWRHLDGSTTTRDVPPARTSWQLPDDVLLQELEGSAQ